MNDACNECTVRLQVYMAGAYLSAVAENATWFDSDHFLKPADCNTLTGFTYRVDACVQDCQA